MPLFAFATLLPVALIAFGAIFGGWAGLVALGYMTVIVFGMDRLAARTMENADPEAEFPAAASLLVGLGIGHLVLLGLCVWAVGGMADLRMAEQVVLGIAGGLVFGQISHPAAHELIHKPSRALRLLGRVIYTTLLAGHHASAHLRVHHTYVASDKDPSSAPLGEGFYRYVLRATRGSFVSAFRAETEMLRRGGKPLWRHPFALYLGGGALCLVLSFAVGGTATLAAYVAMCLYAQLQILMSDYVQHYGLRRKEAADGRLEPVGPQHSWNAPHWFSSALTLNAPRHSDHHVSPVRPYPALQLNKDEMPCLPYPLPVMAVLVMAPPIWRRVMDKRVRKWTPEG